MYLQNLLEGFGKIPFFTVYSRFFDAFAFFLVTGFFEKIFTNWTSEGRGGGQRKTDSSGQRGGGQKMPFLPGRP